MNSTEEVVAQEPIVTTAKPSPVTRTKRQPQYNVIVLDDDIHTFHYVIDALCRICGHSPEAAYRLAVEIDSTGNGRRLDRGHGSGGIEAGSDHRVRRRYLRIQTSDIPTGLLY